MCMLATCQTIINQELFSLQLVGLGVSVSHTELTLVEKAPYDKHFGYYIYKS